MATTPSPTLAAMSITIDELDPRTVPFVKPTQLPELGFGSQKAVYAGIKRGDIPSVRVGHRLLIPTAWVRRALLLDPPAA
jgi:hypothetical protein